MKTFVSDISKKTFPIHQKVYGNSLRSSIFNLIQEQYPDFNKDCLLATDEYENFREEYMSKVLKKELNELSELDKIVVESIKNNEIISANLDKEDNSQDSLGDRIADKVADFGGSWTFIISFVSFLLVWIVVNIFWFANKGFDPYPFILLNLILSCVAALQAPVIMMSQNRQENKDRERAQNDYKINLKAELEIRALHEKIDHLIIHKEQELLEMQKFQLDTIKDLMKKIDELKSKP